MSNAPLALCMPDMHPCGVIISCKVCGRRMSNQCDNKQSTPYNSHHESPSVFSSGLSGLSFILGWPNRPRQALCMGCHQVHLRCCHDITVIGNFHRRRRGHTWSALMSFALCSMGFWALLMGRVVWCRRVPHSISL